MKKKGSADEGRGKLSGSRRDVLSSGRGKHPAAGSGTASGGSRGDSLGNSRETITSTGNARIRNVINLKNKAKERREQDLFLVEGIRMFLEAPSDRIAGIYMSESFYRKNAGNPKVQSILASCRFDLVSDAVFAAMSDTKTPQGVICLIRQFHYTALELFAQPAENDRMKARPPLLMVLEDIQDPGNLGTILRTGEGAGVTGILMSSGCVDIYNPKVIRSTMGSVYRVPFAVAKDLKGTLEDWKQRGMKLYAAHLGGRRSYDQEDYTGPTAFLIGNEGNGLTDETARLADHYILIPMLGQVESLNAGVASALLMYEAARQRRMRQGEAAF